MNVITFLFLFVFRMENTPQFFELPSLYAKHKRQFCIGNSKTAACWYLFWTHRWNDKKANTHCVVFCMPEASPSKLYLLKKGTDSNRYISRFLGVFVGFLGYFTFFIIPFCSVVTETFPTVWCLLTSAIILTIQMGTVLQPSECCLSCMGVKGFIYCISR